MSRSRIAATLAALTVGIAALVGSAAPASADTSASCTNWATTHSTYIRNSAGAIGGGLAVESRRCPNPGDDTYYRQHRAAMLIYGSMRPNTRGVAGIYGNTDAYCVILPSDADRYCATAPVTGAYRARGVVQEYDGDIWITYAEGVINI